MEEKVGLTKDMLEKMGYADVKVYPQPVILLNGIAMKATIFCFPNEEDLKATLDPECPVIMVNWGQPEPERCGYSIRLLVP
jgi:hypothetical protein